MDKSEIILWVVITVVNFGFGVSNAIEGKLFTIVNFICAGLGVYNLLECLGVIV
jgi:hypothetical protein